MDEAGDKADPPDAKTRGKQQRVLAARQRVLQTYLDDGSGPKPAKYADPAAIGKRGKVVQEVEWRPNSGR